MPTNPRPHPPHDFQPRAQDIRERGLAVVTVLIMLVMVASLVSVTSLLALNNRQRSADSAVTTQAQYAAEAAVELALKKIYYDTYSNWKGSTDSSIKNADGQFVSFDSCAFKKWLTGVGNASTAAQKTANNASSCPYINFTATVTSATFANLLDKATVELKSSDTGAPTLPNASYGVTVTRTDQTSGAIVLDMVATGRVVKNSVIVAERQLRRSVQIAADVFEGDKYGMLTSSTNCSFCHLQIDTMPRAYSTDATKTFPAVHVGMLSVQSGTTLKLADGHGGSDTIIHGNLYVRTPLSNISFDDNSTQGVEIDSSGNVKAGANSTITTAGFQTYAVDAGPSATPPGKNKRLYYNYPTAAQVAQAPYNGNWPDVVLPDSFPAAIPDGGNYNISDAEWTAFLTNAPLGKVLEPSTKTAGAKIYGVRRPSSSAIDTTDIPYFYDPLTGTGNTGPSLPINFQAVIDSPTTYKPWIIAQALASPNNRDFMPVLKGAVEVSPVTGVGTTRNNFYVRYDPTQSTPTLSLFYCNRTVATACAVGGDPTATPTSSMSSLSVSLTGADLFPSASNTALDDLMNGTKSGKAGVFDGNLIIDAGTKDGTTNTALKLDGSIYVNGDVVIRGRIKGQGRILARGNIYVVGDLVYDCSDTTTFKACGASDYANPGNLPKLALLAGGNIIVGDYDFADTRVDKANRDFDLNNDQGGQKRKPVSGTLSWDNWNIPGSTGNPGYNGNDSWDGTTAPDSSGRAGFTTRMLMATNAKTNTPRYFKISPFGMMIADGGAPEQYESSNSKFVSNINVKNSGGTVTGQASIIPMYPSNGPFKIGSKLSNGLAYGSVLSATLGCTNKENLALVNRRWGSTPASGNGTKNLNFNYWCPQPSTGSWIRKDGTGMSTGDPNSNASVWLAQSSQDAALDGNNGLTTGWLAGIVKFNGTNLRADLSQTRLLKLMWLSTIENTSVRSKGPLRTDGIFYSANMITSVLRGGKDRRAGDSNTQSRWIHNGSVIASELGFLITASNNGSFASGSYKPTIKRNITMDFAAATGNGSDSDAANKGWGAGIGIFYDDRMSGFLQVTNTTAVKIRRTGIFNPEAK